MELEKAEAHVRGAIRSFGRRLTAALDKIPGRFGHDRHGYDVFDEVLSLALFDVVVGPSSEKRHKLTDEGLVAVTVALRLTEDGQAADELQSGDPNFDDPDEVLMVSTSRLAAALLSGCSNLSEQASIVPSTRWQCRSVRADGHSRVGRNIIDGRAITMVPTPVSSSCIEIP
ncbi:hypothetical protein EN850_03065 [Mesorhizobium sp. M8A.F.Ca.ET.207.01.1.1]|uniref:hypothetical protein n=1 Tax=Mesorhizobium sp. M8A.F.Ca.ET.207.01.1.1 TaxID=2563968 RepID=UPI00109D3A62|nr:hypothetical protein [Mesorhizobium sp. M8A.F.Ca.ET.207.01.1.1]TGQ83739.1 hypothetical protein EN850_03065 [Mesorhizobium sp. M8A.F.Ca.ET.207.01.1.1]